MAAYVEDAAGVSGCSADGTGCDERSQKFLDEWKSKHPQDIHNELDRLMSLMEKDMKHELKDWVKERRDNLKRIADSHDEIKSEL
jgi:flagellar motility protein MotE (MotC chaperone)